MSDYQALYRAWRPERFSDICGQEAVTRTLLRQIESGRIAHAYLFCGSRGTGKTTTAKVLARAINCLSPANGEPCGACAACEQLKNESSMDVLEIDAASNNGVDEVRQLRDRIAYPPTVGKYKVYIIDEVHMLSVSAFNALLKTLEEPPAHAVFILATTEPQKLPATVLSRCQRFDFRRIAANVIVERMRVVLKGIGRQADDDALDEIARAAEGGLRDALSLLDMCLSYTPDAVTAPLVRDVLGANGREFMFEFADALKNSDAGSAMRLIDAAMRGGRDAAVFAREAAGHLRTLLMALLVGDALSELAEITREDAQRFAGQSEGFGQARLMRAMELFMRAEGDMKWVSSPRSVLEACAVRACAPAEGASIEALTERVETLERALREGNFQAPAPAAPRAPAPARAEKTQSPAPAPKPEKGAPREKTQDEQTFEKGVARLAEGAASLRSFLSHMKFVSREDGVVHTRFEKNSRIQMQMLERKKDQIEKALSDAFGESVKVSMRLDEAPAAAAKAATGATLAQTFDIFGRDKVELVD